MLSAIGLPQMIVNSRLTSSIEAIDHEMEGGFNRLHFSSDIEAQYQTDMRESRTRQLIIASLIGLVLYDAFLISDWQMIGDVFREALISRLLVFTPITLALLFLVSRKPPIFVREGMATLHGVLCAIPILWLFSISNAPDRFSYHYGTLIIMLFVTMVQRIHFYFAVTSVIGILLVQFVFVSHSPLFNAPMIQSEMLFYLTLAILIIFAAYTLEHEQRRNYLLVRRGHLLNLQLDRATKIDPLTGLWNRRHLNATLDSAWIDAESGPQPMTVVLLDVDRFKTFNDTYGHIEGDDCLRRLGTCVRTALDDMPHIAVRFGGEEFLVFLPGATAADGDRAARRLRQAIHEQAIPFPAMGDDAIVTASVGVATASVCDVTSTELMAAADQALYEAKRAGRDCIFPRMADLGESALTLERIRAVA